MLSFHLQSMLLTLGMWITYKCPSFHVFYVWARLWKVLLLFWLLAWSMVWLNIYLFPYDGLSFPQALFFVSSLRSIAFGSFHLKTKCQAIWSTKEPHLGLVFSDQPSLSCCWLPDILAEIHRNHTLIHFIPGLILHCYLPLVLQFQWSPLSVTIIIFL